MYVTPDNWGLSLGRWFVSDGSGLSVYKELKQLSPSNISVPLLAISSALLYSVTLCVADRDDYAGDQSLWHSDDGHLDTLIMEAGLASDKEG